MELDIIDFKRPSGYFNNPKDALVVAASWLKWLARVTVIETDDFWTVPGRDGFPQWEHPGKYHREVARQYWNWFYHYHPGHKLTMSDSPDFFGTLKNGALLFGDVGQTSPSAFITTIRGMSKNDIWVTLLLERDRDRQIVIEYVLDIWNLPAKPVPLPAVSRVKKQKISIPTGAGLYEQLGLFITPMDYYPK